MSEVYTMSLVSAKQTRTTDSFQQLLKRAHFDVLACQDKVVAIKMDLGENPATSPIHPSYVKALTDLIREQGGHPFVTDSMHSMRATHGLEAYEKAAQLGYTQETVGAPILVCDGLKGDDTELVRVPDGTVCKEVYIGRAIADADIVISLSHVTAHPWAGMSGAMMNLAGCSNFADARDHVYFGDTINPEQQQQVSMELVERAAAVTRDRSRFHIAFIANVVPVQIGDEQLLRPIVPDVGVFCSFDMVSLDRACAEAVNKEPVMPGGLLDGQEEYSWDRFRDAFPGTDWEKSIDHAERLCLGTREYLRRQGV